MKTISLMIITLALAACGQEQPKTCAQDAKCAAAAIAEFQAGVKSDIADLNKDADLQTAHDLNAEYNLTEAYAEAHPDATAAEVKQAVHDKMIADQAASDEHDAIVATAAVADQDAKEATNVAQNMSQPATEQ